MPSSEGGETCVHQGLSLWFLIKSFPKGDFFLWPHLLRELLKRESKSLRHKKFQTQWPAGPDGGRHPLQEPPTGPVAGRQGPLGAEGGPGHQQERGPPPHNHKELDSVSGQWAQKALSSRRDTVLAATLMAAEGGGGPAQPPDPQAR